jgi:hypothetical protein
MFPRFIKVALLFTSVLVMNQYFDGMREFDMKLVFDNAFSKFIKMLLILLGLLLGDERGACESVYIGQIEVGLENDESGKLLIMEVESSHGEEFL